MTIKEITRWPATKTNGLVPWYEVLRRFPSILGMMLLTPVVVLVIFIGWGRERAIETYKFFWD